MLRAPLGTCPRSGPVPDCPCAGPVPSSAGRSAHTPIPISAVSMSLESVGECVGDLPHELAGPEIRPGASACPCTLGLACPDLPGGASVPCGSRQAARDSRFLPGRELVPVALAGDHSSVRGSGALVSASNVVEIPGDAPRPFYADSASAARQPFPSGFVLSPADPQRPAVVAP